MTRLLVMCFGNTPRILLYQEYAEISNKLIMTATATCTVHVRTCTVHVRTCTVCVFVRCVVGGYCCLFCTSYLLLWLSVVLFSG